jgi:sterol desaturase/sphingolipid hydroxylase (fatty acid hydroxylase superfamily)
VRQVSPVVFLCIAAVAVVVFVGVDVGAPRFRAAFTTDRRLRARNLGYIGGNVASMGTLAVVNAWLSRHIHGVVDWSGAGVVVEVVACVVVAEGINWLSHWIKHVQPWLWNFHIQHHVGRHYDTTLTLHTHPVDVVVSGVAMSAVLLVCGLSKFAVDVFVLMYFVSNLYKHCHRVWSLGPLDWLFVSPAYHRIHHHPTARGNYGSVLTLFDVVFRTAVWPARDVNAVDVDDVGVAGVGERGFVAEMLLPLTPLRTGVQRGRVGP